MKKTNNQGFSLVELIIVIAIMAVLIGVLAPQFIKYVESSREQKDRSAIAEVENAIEIALANETVYQDVMDGLTTAGTPRQVVVTITSDGVITSAPECDALDDEIASSIGDFTLTSNTYTAASPTITITEATGVFSFVTVPTP